MCCLCKASEGNLVHPCIPCCPPTTSHTHPCNPYEPQTLQGYEGDQLRLLVHSLCPSIFGHELVKAGLLLSLFGGGRKASSSQADMALRGDIHVLLVGDPGLGKSQLLQVNKWAAAGAGGAGALQRVGAGAGRVWGEGRRLALAAAWCSDSGGVPSAAGNKEGLDCCSPAPGAVCEVV